MGSFTDVFEKLKCTQAYIRRGWKPHKIVRDCVGLIDKERC